jgi:hypothetical protein
MESANKMPNNNPQRVREKYPPIEKISPPLEQVETVPIVLIIDAIMTVTGEVSKREYKFSGAGSVVNVYKSDVEFLLQKRQGSRQCCGGTGDGNQVFALVEK